MSEVKTFLFSNEGIEPIKKFKYGKNWPVVYIIENGKQAYIGESVRAYNRAKEHIINPVRSELKNIHLITDEEYNVSATLDVESMLIQYMAAEGTFILQNGNEGLKSHNYYDREKYKTKFELVWSRLKQLSLVKKDLVQIRNSDLFKFSPYKELNDDQMAVADSVYSNILGNKGRTYIVNGKPGTGKTILAIYLMKLFREKEQTNKLKVGLVVPVASLRGTIKNVFSGIKGLRSSMVIGPNDVLKEQYDILIVDESHRLKQRKNLTNYRSFDTTNKTLGLGNAGNELDWIIKSSKYQILFYDRNQTIRPTDVGYKSFNELDAVYYNLSTQQRVSAGEEYTNFIDDIFNSNNPEKYSFPGYDFKMYSDLSSMINDIKLKDKELGLCRIVAGYAWKWNSRNKPGTHDIEINGEKLIWNSTTSDWVNSKNAINEVGCIHTVQGYDLNYVGIIIGPELSYNDIDKKFIVNLDNYHDVNGWRGVNDPKEIEMYIINIYKTLLSRGIKGTYVYIVDDNLSRYIKDRLNKIFNFNSEVKKLKHISPYINRYISVPLVGSAPCGQPLLGEQNVEDDILVDKDKIANGEKYFILKALGDSMNKLGINDGDLVLCKQKNTAYEGDKVVALIGDDVTIKEFHIDNNNIILRPRSTSDRHKPLIFTVDDDIRIQGIVQEVIKKNKF
jgi:DUF2075 family protein/SOS-response transcriptional repressor LexA/DNA replication protein DnaC